MQPAFAPDFSILVGDSYANLDETESKATPMLIDVGCELCGDIVAMGDVLVYGQVKGAISAHASRVFIMQSGRVDGTIEAQGILIDGQLVGSCTAECLVVRQTGEVHGTVKSARLILESGGRLLGQSEHLPTSSDYSDDAVRYVVDFLTANAKNLPPETTQSASESIGHPPEITHATAWQLRSWRLSLLLAAITMLVCGIALLLPQQDSEALIREVVLQQAPPPPAPPVAAKRPAELPPPPPLPLSTPAPTPNAGAMPSAPHSAAGQDQLMRQPIPRYKKASTLAPLSEGDWLAALANWQSQALNVLIQTSARKNNQQSALKPLTAQTAHLLIQTRKLQQKYAAQHTVHTSAALMNKGLGEQALKRQYQQELTTLLAQANDSAYHTDSQQLIAALRALTK